MDKIILQNCYTSSLKANVEVLEAVKTLIKNGLLDKHTDKIIMSKDQFFAVILEAMGESYGMGFSGDGPNTAKGGSFDYVNNLFK